MEEKGDGKAWRDTIAAGHLNRETPSDPTGHLFSKFLQSLFSSYLSCLLNDENMYLGLGISFAFVVNNSMSSRLLPRNRNKYINPMNSQIPK